MNSLEYLITKNIKIPPIARQIRTIKAFTIGFFFLTLIALFTSLASWTFIEELACKVALTIFVLSRFRMSDASSKFALFKSTLLGAT